MWYYIILCDFILYYVMLYYIILCDIILYLYYINLYWIIYILYYFSLYTWYIHKRWCQSFTPAVSHGHWSHKQSSGWAHLDATSKAISHRSWGRLKGFLGLLPSRRGKRLWGDAANCLGIEWSFEGKPLANTVSRPSPWTPIKNLTFHLHDKFEMAVDAK